MLIINPEVFLGVYFLYLPHRDMPSSTRFVELYPVATVKPRMGRGARRLLGSRSPRGSGSTNHKYVRRGLAIFVE